MTIALAGCEAKPEQSKVPEMQTVMIEPEGKVQSEIQPARGLNTRLFSEPVKGTNKRFDRVENAVQNLNDEMNVISPAVIKLMAFEEDMRELLDHLRQQRMAEAQEAKAQDAPMQLAKMPEQKLSDSIAHKPPAIKAEQVAKPVATGEGLRVVRLADHKDKTRLVFETATPMNYTVDLDNTEHILIVDFAKGTNSVDASKLKLRSKLVKSVTESAKGGEGFVLAFPLSQETRVIGQDKIAPGKESSNYRYYIDLAL